QPKTWPKSCENSANCPNSPTESRPDRICRMTKTGGPALTKAERVRLALASAEVDRPPYSFWSHFPGTDRDPEALVEKTVRFATELDLDFVKAMPNGFYC